MLATPTTDAPSPRILPPPGTDPTGTARYVLRLVEESALDRRRAIFDKESENGLNFFVGNQWGETTIPGAAQLVLNRVLSCVIAQQAIQAGDPPKITFTARESGEPPLVYVNTETLSGQELAAEITQQNAGTAPPFDPATPLEPKLALSITQAIDEGKMAAAQAAAMGQPAPQGYPTPDAIVEVTERTATEALQTVFDAMWDQANAYNVYVENVLNKNTLGYQPTRYEFDDDQKRHLLENVHPRHVFLDPTKSMYDKCQHQIYLEPISEGEALAKYPDPAIQAEIKQVAALGNIRFPAIAGFTPAYPFKHQFQRGMLAIVHCWIRNQPYPMDQEEAVASGRVRPGEVPTGQVTMSPPDEAGQSYPAPEMRPALLHPTTGEELAPTQPDGSTNPQWPVKYLIRQITCIGNQTIDDRPAEFGDLPIPWNRNVPIPFCPYGQGEPVRLEGLQVALNRVLSSIVTHTEYNAFPPEVVRQEVVDNMGTELRTARSKPGQRIVIPKNVMAAIGDDVKKAISFLETADMPTDFWKLLDFLVRMIDQEGNQADVTQGNAAAGWSGDAIAALQGAAAQVIRGKSMWTEFYLRDLARLMVHSICYRMTPADWARFCKKQPVQALEAIHSKAVSLDVNIKVEIKSGSGASAQQRTSNLLAANSTGKVPISPQTVLEALDCDPDVELQQAQDWSRKQQAAVGMVAPPAGGTPPPAAPAPAPATNNAPSAA